MTVPHDWSISDYCSAVQLQCHFLQTLQVFKIAALYMLFSRKHFLMALYKMQPQQVTCPESRLCQIILHQSACVRALQTGVLA